jgi:hypothetical protein
MSLQFHRRTGIADDRTHHIEPDAGIRCWSDAAFDGGDFHRLCHFAQNGGRQNRKAAHAGKYEYACRLCLGIKLEHPASEIGSIGKIEIVDGGSMQAEITR